MLITERLASDHQRPLVVPARFAVFARGAFDIPERVERVGEDRVVGTVGLGPDLDGPIEVLASAGEIAKSTGRGTHALKSEGNVGMVGTTRRDPDSKRFFVQGESLRVLAVVEQSQREVVDASGHGRMVVAVGGPPDLDGLAVESCRFGWLIERVVDQPEIGVGRRQTRVLGTQRCGPVFDVALKEFLSLGVYVVSHFQEANKLGMIRLAGHSESGDNVQTETSGEEQEEANTAAIHARVQAERGRARPSRRQPGLDGRARSRDQREVVVRVGARGEAGGQRRPDVRRARRAGEAAA